MKTSELIKQLKVLKKSGIKTISFALDTSIKAPANDFCYFDVNFDEKDAVLHNFINSYSE